MPRCQTLSQFARLEFLKLDDEPFALHTHMGRYTAQDKDIIKSKTSHTSKRELTQPSTFHHFQFLEPTVVCCFQMIGYYDQISIRASDVGKGCYFINKYSHLLHWQTSNGYLLLNIIGMLTFIVGMLSIIGLLPISCKFITYHCKHAAYYCRHAISCRFAIYQLQVCYLSLSCQKLSKRFNVFAYH